ncbi:MAG: cheB 8 [Firmicutes bacterium]|nr:cheB 8 [Bacillota bacterium]
MENKKPIVLVVDDQPGIRFLLDEVLTESGYEVVTASNGYEGVEKAGVLHPGLILMDMKMPGMDGIETLRKLKQRGQGDKVIIMTAYGENEIVNQALEIGAFAYLIKPFDIRVLCRLVKEHLPN